MEIFYRLITASSALILMFGGVVPLSADSLDGMVSRYTTDCPDLESAELNITFDLVKDKPEDAAHYSEEVFLNIKKVLGTTEKAFIVESSVTNIEPLKPSYESQGEDKDHVEIPRFWRVRGEMKIVTKQLNKGYEAFVELTNKGYVVTYSSQKNKQDRCKK